MRVDRRAWLAGLAASAVAARLPAARLDYVIRPQAIADGIWIVRGSDEPIAMVNGGAIANITILATPAGTVLVDCGPSLRYGIALRKVAEALTGEPVVRVYLTHLHPDHIYGAGAFDPRIVAATPALTTLLQTEGAGFSDGMYRLLDDWMRGTQYQPPGLILASDHEVFGGRTIRLLPLAGHSPADLALLDVATGTLIAGDLVFHDRAPSTPHADIPTWHRSLATLVAMPHGLLVPGHGPIDPSGRAAIDQTGAWLTWLVETLTAAVNDGLDAAAAGRLPIPARFATIADGRYEFERSVTHLYAGLEAELMPRIDHKG